MAARHLPPLLATILSAGLLLTAPAAHADRVVTVDPAADVVAFTEGADGSEETTPAPDETAVDIVRNVVQHRTHRLRVTVRFRDLEVRRRDQFHFAAVRVVTPQASHWVHVFLNGRAGDIALTRRGRNVECRGLDWSMDEETDKVVVTVPTRCLEAPRWVRIGTGVVRATTEDPPLGELQMFVDDGHRAGSIGSNSIAKGPKVFVG